MDPSSHGNTMWHHGAAVNNSKLSREWIKVLLGQDAEQCEGVHVFTVRYLLGGQLPCVAFASAREPGATGSCVSITRLQRGELLCNPLILPIRIAMDLLLVLLTGDIPRYTSAYNFTWYDSYVTVTEDSHASGYCRMVMMNGGVPGTNRDGCRTSTANEVSRPELPAPAPEHMGLRGIEDICSGVVKHPCGTVFLTTSGWNIVKRNGFRSMMAVQGDRSTQYTFPLCHVEHLPGLLAVLNKWLDGDYKQHGLEITTALPAVWPTTTSGLHYKTETEHDRQRRMYCAAGCEEAMECPVYAGEELSPHPYSAYSACL